MAGQCDRPVGACESTVNSARRSTVEPDHQRPGVALATLLMSFALHGCASVTGGAVELSWNLETLDGSNIDDCDSMRIGRMRLWWQVDGMRDSRDYDCSANHAVTKFEVPEGDALLWVEPQCANGSPVAAADYIAPPPLARTINLGDVVELHAVVIEIDVPHACL